MRLPREQQAALPAVQRTHQEIVRAVATQRHHTAASSTTYDAGDRSEALRLATIICNIVHDAGRTRSILSLLGLKTKIVFMASGHEITEEIRRIVDRFTPLTELERYPKGGRDPKFVPVSTFFKNRGMHPFLRELPFEERWQKDVIFFEGGDQYVAIVTDEREDATCIARTGMPASASLFPAQDQMGRGQSDRAWRAVLNPGGSRSVRSQHAPRHP